MTSQCRTLLALLFTITPSLVAIAEERTPQNENIVIVTSGQLGFQYRGVFFPVEMRFKELTRILGDGIPNDSKSLWWYEKLRLRVGLGRGDELVFGFWFILDERPGPDAISADKIVTDRGVNPSEQL